MEKTNIKKDIVESYEKLIRDCEELIEKEVEKETNLRLIEEYKKILHEVEKKPDDAYDRIKEEIRRVSKCHMNSTPYWT